MTPAIGLRPSEGLMPLAPLIDAGIMIEPPVSSPIAAAHRRATGATPEPWLEPPGMYFLFHALPENVPLIDPENAEATVWPMRTAPCSRSLATMTASFAATLPS